MKTKPTHERRRHATQIAGAVTAFVFVVWLTTLGLRLATSTSTVAQTDDSDNQTQLANIASGAYSPPDNTLEVATTSDADTVDTSNQ